MGTPFSREVHEVVGHVQKASSHLDSIAPITRYALYAIILVSITVPILLWMLLLAVTALLISVNADLVEERKRLVTPRLRWWLKVLVMVVGRREEEGAMREVEREERRRVARG